MSDEFTQPIPNAEQLRQQIHDWRHSPESRMARYRSQMEDQALMVPASVITAGIAVLTAYCVLGLTDDWHGIMLSSFMGALIFVGGDVYELVRDWLETWWLCPTYDRASQPRPKFKVVRGLGPLRFFIYFPIAPLLPWLGLWLLSRHGEHVLPSHLSTWGGAVDLMLLFGPWRLIGAPATFRKLFAPLKRPPSPDCN